jgi:hypothetical protein
VQNGFELSVKVIAKSKRQKSEQKWNKYMLKFGIHHTGDFMEVTKEQINFIRKNLSTKIGQMRHLEIIQKHEETQHKKTGLRAFDQSEDKKEKQDCEIFAEAQPNDGKAFKGVETVLLQESQGEKNKGQQKVVSEFLKHDK